LDEKEDVLQLNLLADRKEYTTLRAQKLNWTAALFDGSMGSKDQNYTFDNPVGCHSFVTL
jgi:hypothetical protein